MKGIRESCEFFYSCRKRNVIVFKYKTRPIPVCWDHFWMLRRKSICDLSQISALRDGEILQLIGIDWSTEKQDWSTITHALLPNGEVIEL